MARDYNCDLGCTFKDKVTGFEGVAVSYRVDIEGRVYLCLVVKINEFTIFMRDGEWIDVKRCQRVDSVDRIVL